MPTQHWREEELRHCRVSSCVKRGCALDVSDLAPDELTVIDCDRCVELFGAAGISGDETRRCDFLIVHEGGGRVVPAIVEMKSGGNVKAKEALAQIEAGICAAERLMEGSDVTDFLPIVVHGGIGSPMELRIFRARKVRFRQWKKLVILKHCGDKLRTSLR